MVSKIADDKSFVSVVVINRKFAKSSLGSCIKEPNTRN